MGNFENLTYLLPDHNIRLRICMPCNPHVTLIPLLIRHNREGWEYYPPQLNFISAMVCERRSLNEGTPEGIVPLWLLLTFSQSMYSSPPLVSLAPG